MPRLSAIDAINPAFERMKAMLFRPFRFKTWLKVGFIGWLAGAASGGGCNLNLPSSHGGAGSGSQEIDQAIQAFFHNHLLLIVLLSALGIVLTLGFIYLASRFRFILLDSVLLRDPQIARGWNLYGRPGHRYFGFWICFMLACGISLGLIVGLPFWHMYRSGILNRDNPFPEMLRYLVPMILGALLFGIVVAIVTSLANDFMVPFMALDGMTVGGAWSSLRVAMSAEPGAFALYLLMRFVLSIAAGLVVGIAMVIVFVVLAIPTAIVVALLVVLLKGSGPLGLAFGILLGAVGVLVGVGVLLMIIMLATAPVAVFMTSYALYFLGGRYPRLGALLWPQPSAPVAPAPLVPPPPLPGAAPAV
jgi:hypothetical protein